MGSQYDYLVDEQDKGVLQNLSQMGARLEELQMEMFKAEAAFDAAKKKFLEYRDVTMPSAMIGAGVSSLTLLSGNSIKVDTKYVCSPNKNDADRETMMKWLRGHGGDYLINEQAIVPGSAIEDLKKGDIPYVAEDTFNTNAVKAFLKSLVTSSMDSENHVELTDIPKCFQFNQLTSVSISAPKK